MKILKWVGIGLLALFLVGLGASLASPEGRRGLTEGADDALSDSTPSPTVTPTPTVRPTPSPTAEPTADPTPEPTQPPTPYEGAVEWLVYSSDRLAFAEDLNAAIDDWELDPNNPFVSAQNALPIWSSLLAEQTDLSLVVPHKCFADWHAEWARIIDLYYEGYDVLTDGGLEYDLAKMDEGLTLIEEANVAMPASNAAMSAVTAACSG